MPLGFLSGLALTRLEAPIAPNACSGALFNMSPGQLKLVINSTVWAFQSTERILQTQVHEQAFTHLQGLCVRLI